jgi:hypothetical protein
MLPLTQCAAFNEWTANHGQKSYRMTDVPQDASGFYLPWYMQPKEHWSAPCNYFLRKPVWLTWKIFESVVKGCLSSFAAEGGSTEVVQLFLATFKGPHDLRDAQGRSPLHYAAQCGKNSARGVVRIFLERGDFDSDSANSRGWSSLCYAIENKNKEIVELLLQFGKVDVDRWTKNYSGGYYFNMPIKPLMLAKSIKATEIIKLLKSHGAYGRYSLL